MENRSKPIVYLLVSLLFLGVVTPIYFHLSLITPMYISFDSLPYLLIALYSGIVGFGFARIMKNFGSSWVLASGLLGSFIFSMVLLVQKAIWGSIGSVASGNMVMNESIGQIVTNGPIETNLLWFLTMVLFNMPLVYSYLEVKE